MTIQDLIDEGQKFQNSINGLRKLTNPTDFTIWTEKVKRFLNQTVPGDMVIDIFDQEVRAFNVNHCSKESLDRLIAVLQAFEQMPQKTLFTGTANMKNENQINITNTLSQQQNQNQNQSTTGSIFSDAIKDEITGRMLKEIRLIVQEECAKPDEKIAKLAKRYQEIGPETMSKILANITMHPEVMPTI